MLRLTNSLGEGGGFLLSSACTGSASCRIERIHIQERGVGVENVCGGVEVGERSQLFEGIVGEKIRSVSVRLARLP